MCGFAGSITFNNQHRDAGERRHILAAMGQQLARRGPDDEQFYDDGILSFVFRRLSIVDLDTGQQPIWNEDQTIFVAVNGEIYNHLELRSQLREPHNFRTQSDAEIVLHLYEERGIDAIHQLNGMFAIVLWDSHQQKLILARDRLGIKPLYYCFKDDVLLFGSELKSLLMHPDCPRDVDLQQLEQTNVQQQAVVPSYIKHVYHLPAGHYLQFARGEPVHPVAYWSIHEHFGADNSDITADDFTRQYHTLLQDSVHKRLMSDVPVGIFLSGGIDSSLICALAAKQRVKLHCFTVVDRSTCQAGDAQQAQLVANKLGFPFHPVHYDADALLDQIGFNLNYFEYLISVMDSPRFDPEWFYKHELYRYARTRIPELKVILLGQGADEFAGGYSARLDRPHNSWQHYLNDEVKPELIQLQNEDRRTILPADYNKLSPYQQKMLRLSWQLQHFNLWHEDRVSSSQSIEARVPFLDHRLVELLASVPPRLHAELFWDKHIVRSALEHTLPEYPRNKKKVGFMFTDDLRPVIRLAQSILHRIYPEFCERYLHVPDAIYNHIQLEQLYNSVSSNDISSSATAVWQLLNCISISVFREQCRNPQPFNHAYLHASPLTCADPDLLCSRPVDKSPSQTTDTVSGKVRSKSKLEKLLGFIMR